MPLSTTSPNTPDYLDTYASQLEAKAIAELRQGLHANLIKPGYQRFAQALAGLPVFKTNHCRFDSDWVEIGHPNELSPGQQLAFEAALDVFIPWKKGPFRLFGVEIDTEWQSNLKWQRLLPAISPLAGRKIADIGCHNGYFMYRMAAEAPQLVVGFEPVVKHWYNFQLLQQYTQLPSLHFEMLGVEHIDCYPQFFDTVFCLGILYHHTDPVGLLRKIRQSMVTGGELVIDCQGIPGDAPHALVPRGRYAQASGIWFLPTLPCLMNWLHRSQFRNIECFFAEPLSPNEQRATKWAPIASLPDFLDPNDPTLTIEGYPAPWRFYVKALR